MSPRLGHPARVLRFAELPIGGVAAAGWQWWWPRSRARGAGTRERRTLALMSASGGPCDRWCAAAGRERRSRAGLPAPCATETGYQRGCRCDACLDAHALRMRAYRARLRLDPARRAQQAARRRQRAAALPDPTRKRGHRVGADRVVAPGELVPRTLWQAEALSRGSPAPLLGIPVIEPPAPRRTGPYRGPAQPPWAGKRSFAELAALREQDAGMTAVLTAGLGRWAAGYGPEVRAWGALMARGASAPPDGRTRPEWVRMLRTLILGHA